MSISDLQEDKSSTVIKIKPATTSISKNLLKIVFSLYLVIAILFTCIHMLTEYQGTKNQISKSLANIEEVVYKSLTITLWNYNIEAVASILEGLHQNQYLEGALITMPTGEKMGFGHVIREGGNIFKVSNSGELIKKDMNFIDASFFGHDFPIYYIRDNGQKEFVGHMYVYSSHARVLNAVRSVFTLIIIAAIIKTLALWFIFVWAIQTRLSVPLKSFTMFMEKLNIESTSFEPVDIHSSDRNELKLLEETFNNLWQKILIYKVNLEEKENTLKHMNENLSKLVDERTEELDSANADLLNQNSDLQDALNELEKTQKKLAVTAHKAGMAEVSSGILHTFGTALNSVNIHNQSVLNLIKKSKLDSVMRVNERFGQDFSEFKNKIRSEGKENDLLELYHTLGPTLAEEKNQLLELVHEANVKIHMMMSTLKAQQKYADYNRLIEKVSIKDVLLDSLKMTVQESDNIKLSVKGDGSVEVNTEKNKLLNILANIILNARDSVLEENVKSPEIAINFHVVDNFLVITIFDNGGGIAESELTDIFKFGYTTRVNHDGFGLHNSYNQVNEIGGELLVHSNKDINETVFTLKFPVI